MKKIFLLLLCVVGTLAVGAFSGFLMGDNVQTWYRHLNRPSFAPPEAVFGPVWTILYILMGISLYLVLRSDSPYKQKAVGIYLLQLFFNFMWSIIFFNMHLMGLALAEIMVLWILIVFMILRFYQINRTAAFLQLPYLLWVTFASFLNGAYFYLN